MVIATLSSDIQVNPDIGTRNKFMRQIGADNLDYPDERIKSFGEKNGITVIPLAPIFRDYAAKHGTFLHGFKNTKPGEGHWNQEGHRLAGETLAQSICAEYR